jgi:hypothetical protein
MLLEQSCLCYHEKPACVERYLRSDAICFLKMTIATAVIIGAIALGVFIVGSIVFMSSFLYSIKQPVDHVHREARETVMEVLPSYEEDSVDSTGLEDTRDPPPAYSPEESAIV